MAALEHGDQTVLLRKGGIKDPTFRPAHSAFALFPTAFHTDAELLKPAARERYRQECECDPRACSTLRLSCWAELTGAWTTTDPRALAALHPLHIYAEPFLEARLRWRPAQPITILELRAYSLAEPLEVPSRPEYWGCFSWAELQVGVELAAKRPALSGAAFAAAQQELRGCLAQLSDLKHLALPCND